MNSWDADLSEFLTTHQTQLTQSYPGLNKQRIHQLIEELNPFGDFSTAKLNVLKDELLHQKPLEYISGLAYFYKSTFLVDERVLIPRSETEILAETIVSHFKKNLQLDSLLEVGVGSGALILSILGELDRPINAVATDISFGALSVAQKNYQLKLKHIHPKTHLDFYWADRLSGFTQKFDCIISNPPYIKLSDQHLVHEQVKIFEPEVALYLSDDIYDQWFNDFFSQVASCLKPQGLLMMEGHEHHLQHLSQLLSKKEFCEIEIINDYTHRPRFIKAKRED